MIYFWSLIILDQQGFPGKSGKKAAFHSFPATADYGYSSLIPPAGTEYGMLPSAAL